MLGSGAPSRFLYVIDDEITTSTRPIRVMTDVGEAFVKHVDNPLGEPALICELVGTRLAGLLGLRTFDAWVVPFPRALVSSTAREGDEQPAFVSRFTPGRPWSGGSSDLKSVTNRTDVVGLAIFDTWTRNRDRFWEGRGERRHNLGNVFIADEGPTLLAIDHTECFKSGRELGAWIAHIDQTKDEDVFGLFPEFEPWLERRALEPFLSRLRNLDPSSVDAVLAEVPRSWWPSSSLHGAMRSAILDRATFVATNFHAWLDQRHAWKTLL